jgi:hypothetical protein
MKRDLFGELASKITDPFVGLQIKLDDPCRCHSYIARVVKGEWLNTPFCCEGCGRERGRLSYATLTFLRRVVEAFGRPAEPIKLKHGNYIETSPQPSGAGAQMQSIAPTGD